jgi:hypothetical protein
MLPNLLSEIVFVVSKLKSTNGLNFSLTAGRSLGRIPDKHMTPPGFIKPQIGTTSRVKAPLVFWKKEKKEKKRIQSLYIFYINTNITIETGKMLATK